MATFPTRGQKNWDLPLKDYLDDRFGVVASSYDRANAALPLSVGSYGYLTPRVVVPPTDFGMTIHYGAWFTVTTPGAGLVVIGLAETTAGVLSEVTNTNEAVGHRTGLFSQVGGLLTGSFHIDPSTGFRTYRLLGGVFRDTSSTLAASMATSNAGGGAPGNRVPFIRVVPE